MVKYCLLFLFFVFASCDLKNEPLSKQAKEQVPKTDSINARVEEAENQRIEFLKKLGEKDLRHSVTETFRFIYNKQYGDYIILTVVAQKNIGSELFPGRMPNTADLFCKLVNSEKVSDSSKQSLSEKEYSEFKMLLNGSYYWTLVDRDCWDGMIRDGNTAQFESMSYTCPVDSLSYTSANLSPLYEGSFKEAFGYLLKRAVPFKGDKAAQRYILRN